METLDKLASGDAPKEFPYNYASEFDPGSPWSLCIALFPETSVLPNLEFTTTEKRINLANSVADFVSSECERLGWSRPLPHGETTESFFLKTRLRQTDTVCRQLNLPSNLEKADNNWVDGIVRTLQLWRRLKGNSTEPSLTEFESWDPEVAFDELISFEPAGWGLRQRLEFLVLPYLKYKDRVDLAQSWVSGAASLEEVKDVVFSPELARSLLQVCISSKTEDWKLVKQVIENIKPVSQDTSGSVSWETIFTPTPTSLKFIADLVEVAKIASLPASRFQQLAEWSLGSAETQLDILLRFLRSSHHFSQPELLTLRKTVFSKVDEHTIAEETIRSALEKSRFMFLKSTAVKEYPEIVRRNVIALANKFEDQSSDTSLVQVLQAIDILDDAKELHAKYEKLQAMQNAFGIDPHYALSHEPLENVSQALRINSDAYLRFTDLVNIVAGGENTSEVAERCVEAALADDNFEAVAEFFDRGFVKQNSPSAWIVYYLAGKYLSPSWDLPRPLSILKQQKKFLSLALLNCPEQDLLSVLNAWSNIEKELEAVSSKVENRPRLETPDVIENSQARNSSSNRNDDPIKVAEEARDHLSNLLVSGIGWAIGANPR